MKKRMFGLIIVTFLSLGLWGCGSKEKALNDAAENLMKATKEWDLDEIKKSVADMGVMKDEGEPEVTEDVKEEEDNDIYGEAFADYIKESNSKMTYEISDIDVDELTVQIKCKYIDSTEFIQEFFKQAFTQAFANAFSEDQDSELSDEEMEKILRMAKAAVKDDKYVEKNIDLVFVEEKGAYKLKKVDEDFANVITANCYGAFKAVEEGFNEDEEADPFEKAHKKEAEAEKDIAYKGTILNNGVMLEITNGYTQSIDGVNLEVSFIGKSGKTLDVTTEHITCLESGEKRMVFAQYYGDNEIQEFELNINCSIVSGQDSMENHVSDVVVKDNVGDDGLIVKVTNNAKKDLSCARVFAVFYKGDKPIFGSTEYAYDLEPNDSENLKLTLPYDRENLENIEFDSYRVYIMDAYSEK